MTGAIGAVAPLSGANTATLGPQGNSCAQFATGPAQRIGQSNVPVLWYLQEFDGDGNLLGSGNSVTTADVNDLVQPGPGAFEIELCVTNTSNTTATLSFQLVSQ